VLALEVLVWPGAGGTQLAKGTAWDNGRDWIYQIECRSLDLL
jgi:hypothetical protein